MIVHVLLEVFILFLKISEIKAYFHCQKKPVLFYRTFSLPEFEVMYIVYSMRIILASISSYIRIVDFNGQPSQIKDD